MANHGKPMENYKNLPYASYSHAISSFVLDDHSVHSRYAILAGYFEPKQQTI
jgi:hypothetical protein